MGIYNLKQSEMLQIIVSRAKLLIAAAIFIAVNSCDKAESTGDLSKAPGSGKGGSMARFAVACDHLYVVDETSLHVMNLFDPANPSFVRTIDIGFGIETIFPFGNYLFIGSSTGMFIYSIQDCSNPTYISEFAHVLSCDPVVTDGTYAYVTLRSGGSCRIGLTANQLDIIDITNVYNPTLVVSHDMPEPWGLGIDGNTLFICHGDHGLGIYDISNPIVPITLHFLKDIKSYDVIPHNKVLIVTGPGGIYQYDYSDIDNLVLLSTINARK